MKINGVDYSKISNKSMRTFLGLMTLLYWGLAQVEGSPLPSSNATHSMHPSHSAKKASSTQGAGEGLSGSTASIFYVVVAFACLVFCFHTLFRSVRFCAARLREAEYNRMVRPFPNDPDAWAAHFRESIQFVGRTDPDTVAANAMLVRLYALDASSASQPTKLSETPGISADLKRFIETIEASDFKPSKLTPEQCTPLEAEYDDLCCHLGANLKEVPVTIHGYTCDFINMLDIPVNAWGERSHPTTRAIFKLDAVMPDQDARMAIETLIKSALAENSTNEVRPNVP